MIQDKSMLVQLTINKWTATKHDKSVSAEVEQTHAAKDAGRYNKRLIDKAHLATITTLEGQIRQYHYSRTLPWTDKGARLLPSHLFMEYRQTISDMRDQFNRATVDFMNIYPQLVQDARVRLNSLFDPADYPDPYDIRMKFGVELEIMPVPTAGDFRVEVAQEEQDEIRNQITEAIEAKQKRAIKDCWQRVREVVTRIAEQCAKENGRIHDSLMDNANDLVSILPGLNITNDPELAAMEADIRKLIVHPDAIRTSPTTRKQLADGAADILTRMAWV